MKRITTMVLALVMVLTMIPTTAFADTNGKFYNTKFKEYFDTLEEGFEYCKELRISEDMTLDSLNLPVGGELVVEEGVTLTITDDAEMNTGYASEIRIWKGAKLYMNASPAVEEDFNGIIYCSDGAKIYDTSGKSKFPVLEKDSTGNVIFKGRHGNNASAFAFHKEAYKHKQPRAGGLKFDVVASNGGKRFAASQTGERVYPKELIWGEQHKDLVEGEDYILTYWYNIKSCHASAEFVGINDYAGYYLEEHFWIDPAKAIISKVTSKKTSITITAKNQKDLGTRKYTFQYRKAGTKKWKTSTIRTTKKTFKNLKRKSKYYVRVQGVGPSGTFPGEWSKTKTIRTK